MSKESFIPETKKIGVAEIITGSIYFTSAAIQADIFVHGGENQLIKFAREMESNFYDVGAAFVRVLYDVGIPVPVILTTMVILSGAVIADGFRRWEKASQKS